MESTCPICKFPLHPNTWSIYSILTFLKDCTFDLDVEIETPALASKPIQIVDPLTKKLPMDIIEYIANDNCDLKTRAKFPSLCKNFKKHMKPNIPSIHTGTFAWTKDLCVQMPTKNIDVKMTDWGEYNIDKETCMPVDLIYLKKMFHIDDEEDDDPKFIKIRTDHKVVHKCCALDSHKKEYIKWKRALSKYLPHQKRQYFKYMLMIFKIIGINVSKDSESILDEKKHLIDVGKIGVNSIDTLSFMQFTPATYVTELERIKQMYGFDKFDRNVWLNKLVNTNVSMVIEKNPDMKVIDYWVIHDQIFKDITFISYIPIFDFFRKFKVSDDSCKLLKYIFNGPPKQLKEDPPKTGGSKFYHLYLKYTSSDKQLKNSKFFS